MTMTLADGDDDDQGDSNDHDSGQEKVAMLVMM